MPRKQSQHRSRSQWKELIAEQENSGQTIKRFCEDRDITISNFYVWRKKIKLNTARPPSVDTDATPLFVELEPRSFEPDPVSQWDIELQICKDIVLRINR